jgi:hypothetical protein
MPNKWHMCKQSQAGNKKRQRRGLLVFIKLPSLPSAGSRSGCFHTSLGCKPRSLIRVSLGWFDYSKCEEGRSKVVQKVKEEGEQYFQGGKAQAA